MEFEKQFIYNPEYMRLFDQRTEMCLLADIDKLNEHKLPDGSYMPRVLRDIKANHATMIAEEAVPYMITGISQVYADGNYYWLDMTGEAVAESGKKFHTHPAALERVDVEIDEAKDANNNLKPGYSKIMISPRMSRSDAPLLVAKDEHLADDDMVRVHHLEMENGKIKSKIMNSLLIPDIPLEAWVSMLKDPNNIIGKSIQPDDEKSALSVMKTHGELYVESSALPQGPITVLKSVIPYITNIETRSKVEAHILCFEKDQKSLYDAVAPIAERHLWFDMELEKSLTGGYASPAIADHIENFNGQWDTKSAQCIARHRQQDGRYRMTRELTALCEASKRQTLWSRAAVMTNNTRIINEIGSMEVVEAIRLDERYIQMLQSGNVTMRELQLAERESDKKIASEDIEFKSGCPGKNESGFDKGDSEDGENSEADCEIEGFECPNCSKLTLSGKESKTTIKVTALFQKNKATCLRCKAWVSKGASFEGWASIRAKQRRKVAEGARTIMKAPEAHAENNTTLVGVS